MVAGPILPTMLSGMWHGYRRWMSLFNLTSIVLSVCLAVVILSFARGVRVYVDDMVRKEAAAGAVRVHLGGWQPTEAERPFVHRIEETDAALRGLMPAGAYQGFNLWWRSEAHFLSLRHPADDEGRGIFTKMGNTHPDDPEGERVRPFTVAGGWVTDPAAAEIVLSAEAALKLSRRLPSGLGIRDLVDREIWIVLPATQEHAPAASARVRVTGIFDHMRDQACMTTPCVIQQMFARIRANANGKWHETYDRLSYRVSSLRVASADVEWDEPPVPLLCWRVGDYAESWVHLGGPLATWAEPGPVRALRRQAEEEAQRARDAEQAAQALEAEREDALLLLDSREQNRQWLTDLLAVGHATFPETGDIDTNAVGEIRLRLSDAAASLDLDPAISHVGDRAGFLASYAAVEARIAQRLDELESRTREIGDEMTALAEQRAAAAAESARLVQEADALALGAPTRDDVAVEVRATLEATGDSMRFTATHRQDLPPSPRMTEAELEGRHPEGYVLCSPRTWSDLGYRAAPLVDVGPWQDDALYAYLYFRDLSSARQGRSMLQAGGFDTYMPIDRFRGLVSIVRMITWGALTLLAAVLTAGLLGIAITLYTEVDAEEREIGLLKALGASNRLIGGMFLLKGGLIGLVGAAIGIPLAWTIGIRVNHIVSGAVAHSVGLTEVREGFFSREPWMIPAVAIAVVTMAAVAALMPALQAARKDPQEALRAE